MPLLLTQAFEDLLGSHPGDVFVIDKSRAKKQDIRPIRIAILDLMPNKDETELQLLRHLSNQPLQMKVDLLRTKSYQPKHADINRLINYYKTLDEVKDRKYDGMIVTGAPLEKVPYEKVAYWEELKEVFDFAQTHVYSTLFICWASQAALHYFYNVDARLLTHKISGIYRFPKQDDLLMKGFDDDFAMPHSRYSRVEPGDLAGLEDLEVLAASEATGLALAATKDKRFIFDFGHFEYDRLTLHEEYQRDLAKGLNPDPPANYYAPGHVGDPDFVRKTWSSSAGLFFANWINYVIYQKTPYDIEAIRTKSVSKFGGSSLSDASQFRKVKEIIQSSPDRTCIVVSAPGKRNPLDTKVTDSLISIADKRKHEQELEAMIAILTERQKNVRQEIQKESAEVSDRFLGICGELAVSSETVQAVQETISAIQTSDDRDYIISRGEYLNARIMADYLDYRFVDAKDLILFDDQGEVDLAESNEAIRDQIQAGDRVVVPGFYGSQQGKIKCLARGGSDYTGSLLSSALDTEIFENWTDVNGVMSADPGLHADAENIPTLSYDDLRGILEQGAQVYQKEALKPVQDKNIPIHILNTNDPGESGTWVSSQGGEEDKDSE